MGGPRWICHNIGQGIFNKFQGLVEIRTSVDSPFSSCVSREWESASIDKGGIELTNFKRRGGNRTLADAQGDRLPRTRDSADAPAPFLGGYQSGLFERQSMPVRRSIPFALPRC